jgi:hypothetical protein
MAVPVVQHLEQVDVGDHDGDRLVSVESCFQPLVEERSVRKLGERVVARQALALGGLPVERDRGGGDDREEAEIERGERGGEHERRRAHREDDPGGRKRNRCGNAEGKDEIATPHCHFVCIVALAAARIPCPGEANDPLRPAASLGAWLRKR